MSLREQILQTSMPKPVAVVVPEWGTTIHVKHMTGLERDQWEQSIHQQGGFMEAKHVRASLIVQVALDAEGQRVFKDGDEERLSKQPVKALERVWVVACDINQLSQSDIESLKKTSSVTCSG